jgi:hypothetical protein
VRRLHWYTATERACHGQQRYMQHIRRGLCCQMLTLSCPHTICGSAVGSKLGVHNPDIIYSLVTNTVSAVQSRRILSTYILAPICAKACWIDGTSQPGVSAILARTKNAASAAGPCVPPALSMLPLRLLQHR